MKVDLKNGHAVIKDTCPLRFARDYEKALLSKMDAEYKLTDMDAVNRLQMELVIKLTESITVKVDGKDQTVTAPAITEDWLLDNLSAQDYLTIEDSVGELSGKWETKVEREKKRALGKTAQ